MNIDNKVINDFNKEWQKYNYLNFDKKKLKIFFNQYFEIFPWDKINQNSIGFDMGCGSGRWAQFVAPRVKTLICVEPSDAIKVAKINLNRFNNVKFLKESTNSCTIKEKSQDFGYCLGVLHHIPDPEKALKDCAKLLKSKSPFLLYLYYNFENKPKWFKLIWKVSDFMRKVISKMPNRLKILTCTLIAYLIYLPLSRTANLFERLGLNISDFPLADYRSKPMYICKNDALDRFGTSLEYRFSKNEIKEMLYNSGFENITFSKSAPYWCCIAYKK